MPLKRVGAVGSAVGAVALGVLLIRGSAPAPVTPGPQTQTRAHRPVKARLGQSSTAQPDQLPEDGPWQASREHFAGAQGGECASIEDKGGRWCVPHQEKLQAIIAILPDPVNTHMALVFDRSMEAIQLAAQSMNYVEDRYWLPWDPSARLDWQDYDSQQKAEEDAEQKQKEPGLLLFRWNGDTRADAAKTLYVFLVSETSTAGVDGEQFSRALEYRNQVCRQGGCPAPKIDPDRIRILGPTFSGSLASLVRLTRGAKFAAYSGTASSTCAVENQHLAPHSELCDQTDNTMDGHLTFQSFVSDTESAIISLLTLLQNNRDISCTGRSEVAILAEAATTYGAVQRRFADEDDAEHGPAQGKKQNAQAGGALLRNCSTSFSYPREISTLRNAYDKNQSSSPAQSTNSGQPFLPLNLTDQPANKSDEPPDFSKGQGPISKEAVLMRMASELRQNQYKYIGVIGSNVLDVLFLTSFLRKSCPDARLFVVNSDLLFERELDNAPYIGMLAVTTYPFVSRNLDWTNPKWPNTETQFARLPFADQYEEGQYNAFLEALVQTVPGKSGSKPTFYERQEPFTLRTEKSPLWLTAVGTGGYWPIQLLSPPELIAQPDSQPPANNQPQATSPVLQDQDFSSEWKVLMTFLCGLGLLHIWILITSAPGARWFRDFSLLMPQPGQRLFFIHSATAALTLSLVMMAAPAFRFGQHTVILTILEIAVVLVVAGLLLACLLVNVNCRFSQKWKMARNKETMEQTPQGLRGIYWAAIGVWSSAILAGGLWFALLAGDPGHFYGFFFAYRAVQLATGISPFTPMLPLFAAVYTWCIFELWRLRFNDRLRPRLKATHDAPGASTEERVANSVSHYFLGPYYIAGLAVLFLIWLLLFDVVHPFQLFENRLYGPFFEVLFCVGVIVLLAGGFRLGQLWANLRKLLLELERSPIRFAFGRLQGVGWSPIWRQGGEEAEWSYLSRSLEAMRRVGYCNQKLDLEMKTDIGLEPQTTKDMEAVKGLVEEIRTTREQLKLEKPTLVAPHMNREFRASSPSQPASPTAELFFQLEVGLHQLQDRLADVLQGIWSVLDRRWKNGDFISAEVEDDKDEKQVAVYCNPEKSDPKEEQIQKMEEFVALRYVDFIRGALGHMRFLLIFLGISFTLVLISLNVYSFEPHQTLLWSFTAVFIVIGFLIFQVLMQVHRDHILNRIAKTKPSDLGIQFYLRIVSVGIVPLLTLLATHFPSIGRFLVSLVQPGLEALK